MKRVSVANFKAEFSSLLEELDHGRTIAIEYGRRKEVVALLVPPTFKKRGKRRLGILKGEARFETKGSFKMDDEEFLRS